MTAHLIVAALLVLGCESRMGGPPGGATADAGGLLPADAAAAPSTGPGLRGVLKDESEQPVENALILACMSRSCLFGRTEAGGRFRFDISPPAAVALKTPEDVDVTPRRGALLVPVLITGDLLVDVGAVHLVSLPMGVPFAAPGAGRQSYATGDGLELTLDRAALTPRLGDVRGDVAARRLSPESAPLFPGLMETVVAVYSLHPFGATSAAPMAVRAPAALPAGTPVRFRTVSEIDGQLSPPAAGRADGTTVATDPGVGIGELTLLVVSR